MDKAIAICLTALLLLSGCLDASDDDDPISIVGCDDENSLTYSENVTESNDELCASEELLESGIFAFIELMEDGPDFNEVDSTMGYTMEVSSKDNWSYMETVVVNPTGYKVTSQNNYEDYTTVEEMIISGNQIQYTMIEDGESMQVRMKHAGTYEDLMETVMNSGDDEGQFICDNGEEIPQSWVNDGEEDCDDGSDEGVEFNDNSDDTEGRQTTQITSLDISQDNDMVTIAITGDFSDDPATAPYYTMMLIKNGNDPEYAISNIQEEDNFNEWDYLEAGYAEINIPTDGLLSGYFDVVFSVWLESQSSDTAVSSQFTFYVAESDDNSDDGGEEMFRCDNGEEIQLSWVNDGWEDCDDGSDEDGIVDNSDDGEDPSSSDYTVYFTPNATFTGFDKTESGMTFTGLLNIDGAPYGNLEVYTTEDFTVTGFALMDVSNSANWVKFMLINSGSTTVDETIPLDALPFMLIQMDTSDDSDDGEDEDLVDNDNDGYDETQDCDDNDPWIYPDNPEEEIDGLDNDCDGLVDYEDDNCGECWDELFFAFTDLSFATESNTSLDQILEYQSTYWRATNPDADSQTPFGIAFSEMSAEDIELIFKEVDTDESSTLDESEMAEFHTQIQDQIWDEYNGESHDHDDHDDNEEGDDEIAMYRCVNFVDESVLDSTTNFSSVFNNSNLDYSLCDTSAEDVNYTFENSTFTLPTHMMYESCWEEEPNVTMCDYGTIEAVNGSELYETVTMEDDESADDCEGEYKNESNTCTVWSGNITDSDANGFTISDSDGEREMIVFYQYDSQLNSGILIVVNEEENDDYDGDGDWSFDRELQDCDSDDDTMVSYDELEACIDEDLANDGYGHMSASDVHAYDEFNMSDMNNDSMLNESEFDYLNSMLSHQNEDPNYQEMFSMMDSDEDGEVTFSEWENMNNQSDDPMPEDEVDTFALIINFFDQDDSGGLDFSEFENMMYTLDSEDDAFGENPELMFAVIDSNSDGEVTLEEWVASSNNSDEEPMTQEDIDGLSNMMDMFNEDDSMGLNYTEFKAMMETMDNGDMEDNPEFLFAMIDANDDGEVTASEWADSSNQSEDEEPMSDEEFEMFSAMINNFDSDSSGGLDFEEFMKMMDEMDDEDSDMLSDSVMFYVFGMEGLEGDLDDYSLVLAQCTQEMDSMTGMMMLSDCGEDAYSVQLSSILMESEVDMLFSENAIMFMDSDESGTLTMGDVIVIDASSDEISGEWNGARLHSEEADSYSDENPMMPGFTGILATIGLLGAALIRRE
ncbi:MopE-related protein [Candidatus Poseidoniaceae archaeon]|nr:MopE-related protein [Candidatus Poseidoniaceae archaeon]